MIKKQAHSSLLYRVCAPVGFSSVFLYSFGIDTVAPVSYSNLHIKVEALSVGRQPPSDKTVLRTVAVLPFGGDTVDIFSVLHAERVFSVRAVDIADILNAVALFKTLYRHGIRLCVKPQRSF